MAPRAERPLRVAVVTETFLPKIDGIVTRLCHTVRHLQRLGHHVLIVAPKGVADYEGVPVHGVSGFAFPLYPELKLAIPRPSIGRALDRFRPDLVHAVNPAVLGVSAFSYSVSRRIPLIVSYHTHLPKYLKYYRMGSLEPLMWWGMRQGYNRADLILATSQAMQTALEEQGIHRVQVWQRGVDTDRFHPAKASGTMRSRLTGGHPHDKLMVYIGRLSAEKEIERCREVLEALPGVRLALVGDGPHRAALEKYFAGTPTVFTGFLAGDDLAAAFASADTFFLPSRTETLGLVLLEAMAAGCPVVTARSGGTSDVVQDGITGYLCDPADAASAVKALQRLLFDPAHREALSRNARQDAEQWGWAAATAQLESLYRGVMEKERRLTGVIAWMSASGTPVGAICDQLEISRQTYRRQMARRAEGRADARPLLPIRDAEDEPPLSAAAAPVETDARARKVQ